MIYTLTQLNSQYVEADGLIDGATKYLGDGVTLNPFPTYINNATGTLKVKNPAGTFETIGPAGATVANAAYVASSNGDYRFLITNDFNPTVLGQGYTVIIDLTATGGFVAHWEIPAQVAARKV